MSEDSIKIKISDKTQEDSGGLTSIKEKESETASNLSSPKMTEPGTPTKPDMPSESPQDAQQQSETPQINLLDINITDENTALNVLVGFLGIAQRRGVFAINESAKIHECIQKFQRQ